MITTATDNIKPTSAPISTFLTVLGDDGLVGTFAGSYIFTCSVFIISTILALEYSATVSAIFFALKASSSVTAICIIRVFVGVVTVILPLSSLTVISRLRLLITFSSTVLDFTRFR